MGQASEMMIAEHNARMESNEDYREEVYDNEREYHEALLAEIEHEKEAEMSVDWFSDRRIDLTGYEEFDCDLCGKPCDNDFGHNECQDYENFWSEQF